MAQKRGGPRRGPGRPMNPGPTITPSAQINIPNELIENYILKELDSVEADIFHGLPQKTKDLYVGTIKNSLFGLRAKNGSGGSNILNYGDEFQDRSGVQVSLSLNPEDWKDPPAYVKKTIKGWIQGGVFNFDDYSREVEKGIVSAYLRPPTATLHGSRARAVGPLSIQNANSNLLERNAAGDIVGRGGKKDYLELSGTVGGWIDESRSLTDRDQAISDYNEGVHKIIEKEFYSRGTGVAGFSRNYNADTDVIAQQIEADLHVTNAQARNFLQGFEHNSDFTKSVSGSIFKNSHFTVEDDLDWLKINGSHLKNSHYWRSRADSILNSSITENAGSFSGNLDPLRLHMRANWQSLGFSSASKVDEIFKKFRGQKLTDINKGFAGSGIFLDTSFTSQEIASFKSAVTGLEERASGIKSSISSFQEAQLMLNEDVVLDYMTSDIANAAIRDQVKKDLQATINWKKYIHLRSTMLSQKEFIDAINDGDVYKIYFFLGKTGIKQLAGVSEIKKKLDTLKIGRGGMSVGDALKNWGSIKHLEKEIDKMGTKEAYKAFKLGRLNPLRLAAYKLGLASEGIKYADAKILQKLLPYKLVGNHAYLYTGDFAKKSIEFGANKLKLDLFSNQNTFNSFRAYDASFSTSSLAKIKPSTLVLYANQLNGLDDAFAAITFLADNWASFGGRNTADMGRMFLQWKGYYHATGNMDFLDTWGHFRTIGGTSNLTRYKDGLGKIFDSLDKIKSDMSAKGLVLDDQDLFSLVISLSKDKGFLNGSNKLVKYMSVLDAIASHLSAAQSFVYNVIEKKILEGTLFKIPGMLGVLSKKVWGWYNPGIGSVQMAQSFATTRFGAVTLKLVNKAITPILTKLGFSALTAATAGTAYLGVLIAGAISALAKGAWGTIRHLDLLAIPKALFQEINNLIISPTKFLLKTIAKGCLAIFLIVAFFIILFSGGSVAQYDRDFGATAYLGDIYDDPLLACRNGVSFIGSSASGLDPDPVSPVETSCYGWRSFTQAGVTKYNFHTGIDYGVPTGTPILSPYQGTATVISAGANSTGYGNLVVLKANGADIYIYLAHMSRIDVTSGQAVNHRQQVGLVGSTGNSTGPHLHYEIRSGSASMAHSINPCSVFSCGSLCSGVSSTNLHGRGACFSDYETYLP